MATVVKQDFSESTNGRPIEVVSDSGSGTLIHTSQSNTGDNNFDEVWAWATNTSTAGVKITILWGGTTDSDDYIEVTIPPEAGLTQIIPGLVLQGSAAFRVIASSGNTSHVNIVGFVNKMTA